MLRYTVARLLQLVPVLFGITLMSFVILRSIPGDPLVVLSPNASEAALQRLRVQYGLDRPLPFQYLAYLDGILHGDLGVSIRTNEPVAETILRRLRFTVTLTLFSIVLGVVVGVLAGVYAATHQDMWVDHVLMLAALALISIPGFWLSLLLLMLFAAQLHLLPVGGAGTWQNLVLPVTVIGLESAAVIARYSRASMLDAIRQDFIRTARSNGLSEDVIVYKHALRNALNPVLTMVGLEFGFMLGGAAIIESIFAVPGIGRLMVDAVYTRDYPVIQGGILLVAVTFSVVNLLTDLCYALVNPRIRYS